MPGVANASVPQQGQKGMTRPPRLPTVPHPSYAGHTGRVNVWWGQEFEDACSSEDLTKSWGNKRSRTAAGPRF